MAALGRICAGQHAPTSQWGMMLLHARQEPFGVQEEDGKVKVNFFTSQASRKSIDCIFKDIFNPPSSRFQPESCNLRL